jgi:dTDP-glucose 4,6-dehydratase/UDP-glucose 4,6-dehydratase
MSGTLLVTGGCGFIGSNFINVFFRKYPNIRIVNVDAMYYSASLTNIDKDIRESSQYVFIKCDITNPDFIFHILADHAVDYVVHFAAQSHVQNSFEHSIHYTRDNIVGTHVLIESIRKYGGVKKMIHMSTDEVYGESSLSVHESKKTEQSLLFPTNPYAATKAGAELIVSSYVCSFQLPVVIVRCNNVYGPNQYPEKLIPLFITQLLNDKPVTIQGTGANVRGFLHVHDVANAFVTLFEKGVNGEIYNIGCIETDEFTVMDIATMLIKQIKPGDDLNKWITYIDDRPFNDKRYYICCEKIKALGWKQEIEFHDGLRRLVYLLQENAITAMR